MSAERKEGLRDLQLYGEVISTAFVESTVNQVISKRFVKQQQMRFSKKGRPPAAAGASAGSEIVWV